MQRELHSLFVGNLLGSVDIASLRNYFIRAGDIKDIYIPKNQLSNFGVKYAFIRLGSAVEANQVIKRCNGDFVWGYNITVRKAHKERREALGYKDQLWNDSQKHRRIRATHWKDRFQETGVRSQTELQSGDQTPAEANLEYKAMEGDLKYLQGCAVGYLTKPYNIYGLQSLLQKQSIQCSIRYLGGKMVLLSFLNEVLMKEVISANVELFEKYFEYIKPWEEQDLPKQRYVWLIFEDIPLHAWNQKFFELVGNLYGTFLAIDKPTESKERIDAARVLVHTHMREHIKRKHRVRIDGKLFIISVNEDLSLPFSPMADMSLLSRKYQLNSDWLGEGHMQDGALFPRQGIVEEEEEPIQISNLNSNLGLGAQTCDHRQTLPNQNFLVELGQEKSPSDKLLENNPAGNISPANSIQTVPESPLVPIPLTKPANIVQHVEPEEGELPLDSNIDEDVISPIEDQYVELEPTKRTSVRMKRISRRKELSAIGDRASSGKILKFALGNQLKNFKHKYVRKRRKKDKRKHPRLTTQEDAADDPIPEENTSNRKEEILKTAKDCWNLGMALGMTAADPTDNVLDLMVDIVERDWDEYERIHNE